MSFMYSFKRLEKLCRESMNDDKAVKAYIDEMNNICDGAYYVKDWDNDLNRLKHYNRVRNKISHDPECNEENMCSSEDEYWLDEFYHRIMNQTDPLALYRKATQINRRTNVMQTQKQQIQFPSEQDFYCERKTGLSPVFATLIISILLIAAVIGLWLLAEA